MDHIFVYADSLTWGIVPNTRQRLAFEERWPMILEEKLNADGRRARVTEDCLNGRRTVWEDPFKPGRNGLIGLAQKMEIHSPLALVILMLGTNDFQFCHTHNDAWSAAQGVATLVNEIRRAPIEPGMPVPRILVICPPVPQPAKGAIAPKFQGSDLRCGGLAEAFATMAAQMECAFFDANTVIRTSTEDGVHLDAASHRTLGAAIEPVVRPLLDAARA